MDIRYSVEAAIHIQHTEEKKSGSVTSDTQAANRPDEAEQTCDQVVDDQMRRNISNMDINEQESHPNISSPTATESEDMNREVESERPNSCADSNITTCKLGATNEDVETASIEEAAKVSETPVQVLNDDGQLEESTIVTETPVQVLNDDGQLEENTSVIETPVQGLNDDGQLEENTNVTETPVQVLSGNGQLEETETPVQVLEDNGQLKEKTSVTETSVQVHNGNVSLKENTIVTKTPVQVLDGNGRRKENASVTEKGVEKRHNSSKTHSFPSPSGSGNSKNTEKGLKKVAKKKVRD
ncbi:hypothetical protein C0Q70_04131 [Pomacea canaliculata]|uniref:Uncharacterized protein n=1 Tax=Pomacea canaliculata TaxID=400727 RepID=A0A2T7PUM7_POMCA|nr:hypothetical protein C0Q70_04131 [Pomacea canaliculata]